MSQSKSKQAAYVQARESLLAEITESLRNDERFVAAWLAGSYGRGEQTWQSDLDIHVVVADAYSESLCAMPWPVGAHTTPERLALFSEFGTPTIIFDAHGNNFMGGTFTYVVYQESGHNVDWMLIPQGKAHQEHRCHLLFDKVGIPDPPVPEPENLEECMERASEQVGFFWMIAASNGQNLLKGYLVHFHTLLTWLENSIREVRAALKGEHAQFTKASRIQLYTTQEEQVAALRRLCDEMERLMPAVVEMGGYLPTNPRAMVEMRLQLLEDE